MSRIRRHLVSLLLLSAAIAQLSGIEHLLEEQPCAADCAGDDDHGDCPPTCTQCACCPQTQLFMTADVLELAEPQSASPSFLPHAGAVPSVDPRRIEHVPRSFPV